MYFTIKIEKILKRKNINTFTSQIYLIHFADNF